MGLEKGQMLYEGKAKRVYQTEEPNQYIVSYKDDATAFNGEKRGTIVGKGRVNNLMSARLFQHLGEAGIPNHFISLLNDREMAVKAVTIIPLEVIVRNIAAGSFSKRLGVPEGKALPHTVLEFCYKNDALGDPLVNEDHILAMELATPEEIEIIKSLARKVNTELQAFLRERELILVDFKLEFGKYQGEIILADEISPDTCRLWDASTGDKLDKDRFRRDLGGVEEAYEEVLRRLNR